MSTFQEKQGQKNSELTPPSENGEIRQILQGLRQDVELEKQKEEMRKKYDQYKKMFYNEKHEKECRAKEL